MMLRVESVTAGYGDLVAIRDISFELDEGSTLGLIGRNGAGKSTTLRAVAGLNRAINGRIFLRDRDITADAPNRRSLAGIALVAEGRRIFAERTVAENLIIGAFASRLSRSNLRARMEDAYALFPILGEFSKRRAGFLSGGQQQMLAIAQALMSRPQVLLLDEPSSGLAPSIVTEVLRGIAKLRDESGLSVVLVEQAPELALSFADAVVVLDLGRIALTGLVSEQGLRERIHSVYFAERTSP